MPACCPWAPAELLAAVQAEAPSCSLVDFTPQLPQVADARACFGFLRQVVEAAVQGAGSRLYYAQRTPENAAGFDCIFGLTRHAEAAAAGKDLDRVGAAPEPPGWLAWVRDDYMYCSAENDAHVSGRQLAGFALGVSECCICLERVQDERSICLPGCAHQIHTRCLTQLVQPPAAPPFSCPVCRSPFAVDRHGRLGPPAAPAAAQRPEAGTGEVELLRQPAPPGSAARIEDEAACAGCCRCVVS